VISNVYVWNTRYKHLPPLYRQLLNYKEEDKVSVPVIHVFDNEEETKGDNEFLLILGDEHTIKKIPESELDTFEDSDIDVLKF